MKGSLITSAVLHGLVLAFLLLKVGGPEQFDVANSESLPVSIVPIEELTQIQQGDKKAPKKEKAAPTPTKKQTKVENAENSGENDVDLKTPPTPTVKPENTESAAAPEKSDPAPPTPDPKPTPTKDIQKETPQTAPATEVAAKAEPKVDVKPDPIQKAIEDAPAEPAPTEALPDNVPVPQVKPKPAPEEAKPADQKPDETKKETAEAQTAKTADKTSKETKKESAKASSSKESDFNADEVAALLNKKEASGGGAKRSSDEAALGGKKTTGGSKLSQSEMDALKGMIEQNWSIIPGMADAQDVRIQVKFNLDEAGEIVGEPEVTATGGSETARNALAGGARRAVMKSAPFKNLPADKYDAWSEVTVNFDPSQLM
jgi:hypothetical protein